MSLTEGGKEESSKLTASDKFLEEGMLDNCDKEGIGSQTVLRTWD